jgi:ubiquinone/menaquinone biosynthesis C-methylase UbiE
MNFDRLAPHYDWIEAVTAGERLQRARTVWLDELRGRQRILSVGEGHGRFAKAFVDRFPETEITLIESSPRMLARAQRRLGPGAAAVRWHCGDVLAWKPDGPFDVIVTCFFLDCFPPDTLATVVDRLSQCAAPNALWLVVDFALPQRGLARWRAQAVHWLMYAFFRQFVGLSANRLTSPDKLLRAHGFELTARREFEWGLVRADLWRRSAG